MSDKYIKQYKPAERSIIFNDDKDLAPIELELPLPPPLETIEGYGLPAADQFWRHKALPPKLKALQNKKTYKDNEDDPEEKAKVFTPRLKILHLEKNAAYYADEIKFIQEEWRRRDHGHWFFNNGVPTFITGDNYYYLQAWTIDDRPVRYRNRDRKWFLFWWMVDNDDNCYGFNYPKQRREGATTRVSAIRFNRVTSRKNFKTSLQSKDEVHASKVHEENIVAPSKNIPFYWMPMVATKPNVTTEIKFGSPETMSSPDYGQPDGLNSILDYYDSGTKSLDGLKRWLIHNDEIGKCNSLNTKILMYDGSIKLVQNIVPGDLLMGPDSKPRKVLSVTSGEDEMYDVVPNKGETWGCNKEHILSLKSCYPRAINGVEKWGTLNIAVKDYLKLEKTKQTHLLQYRVGVEFPETPVWEPYYVGYWLGNGDVSHSKCTVNEFHNNVIAELEQYAKRNQFSFNTVKEKGCYRVSFGRGSNNILKSLDLIYNKHVPRAYLVNSRKNRLELLAGILDSDGHKHLGGYEITQKNKSVADSIVYLCQSLGYSATITEVKKGFKRENGSRFTGTYHRISIYGNTLHEIPLRCEYKKQPTHSTHKNRRDPQKTGFKLVHKGRDKYYGFTLDGDHLYLLGDFTVTHNTETVDVETRWQIQRPCLTNLDPDYPIKGKAINTSTVDEMQNKGGRQFKNICDGSHYYNRPANNETETGLYNLFIPASEGMEGFLPGTENSTRIPFYDKYGNCDSVAIEKYLLDRREAYRKAGKIAQFIEECRLYPLTYADCWKTSAKQCNFNLLILEERLEFYRNGNPDKVRGNFVWAEGRDSWVKWEPSEAGKFYLSWNFPDPKMANKYFIDPEGRRVPASKKMFVAGADPFKFAITKGKKKSNGAGAVFYKFDPKVDDPAKMDEWKSHRFICTYSHRPSSKEEYGEDMIKMCHYFGCEMNPETNVPMLWDYFVERGYGGYLYYKFDPNTGKVSITPGSHTGTATKEQIFSDTQSYIELHGMRERHDELLIEWKTIEDDLGDFDLTVAAGKALEAATQHGWSALEENQVADLSDYVDQYDYSKQER